MTGAAVVQAKQLTQDEYAMNHPSGRIGKRLMLRVSDVMLTGGAVPRVPPQVRLITTCPSCHARMFSTDDMWFNVLSAVMSCLLRVHTCDHFFLSTEGPGRLLGRGAACAPVAA